MLRIDLKTFEFVREDRTHCVIKIEKEMLFSDFYRKNAHNHVIFGLFYACCGEIGLYSTALLKFNTSKFFLFLRVRFQKVAVFKRHLFVQ